jgi:hypothetical protein
MPPDDLTRGALDGTLIREGVSQGGSMAKAFQAIVFVMIDFDEAWDRLALVTGYAQVRYTALGQPSRLSVVIEAPTGALTTYSYEVDKGEEVLVIDQVVHVPARCVSQREGNSVQCG